MSPEGKRMRQLYLERTAREDEFIASIGWKRANIHRRYCLTILENPRHRCVSPRCFTDERMLFERHDDAWNLDHCIVLVHPTERRYAVLSQTYSPLNPGDRAKRLGPAPYGFGTIALLYEGKSA